METQKYVGTLLEKFSPPAGIEPGATRSVGQHANPPSYRGS
ncbi:MAG: hypothetical protein AB2693_33130 [Candidatus Thiodiazotropha sp.]